MTRKEAIGRIRCAFSRFVDDHAVSKTESEEIYAECEEALRALGCTDEDLS